MPNDVELSQAEMNAQILRSYKFQKSQGTLRNIQDLENIYYPWKKNPRLLSLKKIDDPWIVATPNVHNAVYGQLVWDQTNMLANAWGSLAKEPWIKSGQRVKKARGVHSDSIAETDNLPDAEKPDIEVLLQNVKIAIHRFQISEISEKLSATQDDDVGDPLNYLRNETSDEHIKSLNEMLNVDLAIPAGTDWDSLDRAIASAAEAAAKAVAGDEDFEGVDRSAESWYDSFVDFSTNNRDITKAMIKQTSRDTRPFWTKTGTRYYLTGPNTMDRVSELYEPQNRFGQNMMRVQPGVNGIKVIQPGVEAGFNVISTNGFPWIVDYNIVTDGIERVYFIDSGSLRAEILAPTQYAQQGVSNGNPWASNKLVDDGIFWTEGNLRQRIGRSCAKVRDLQ